MKNYSTDPHTNKISYDKAKDTKIRDRTINLEI